MDDWESDLVPQRFETTSEMHLCTFCNAAQDGDIEKVYTFFDSCLFWYTVFVVKCMHPIDIKVL